MKDWDLAKKRAFTKAMKRPSFAKGGMIRKIAGRHYFDDGGNVTAQNLTTPGTNLSGPSSGGTVQNASNPNTGIMGTIGGALGLNNNFQASSANIQQGTNQGQLNQAYNQTQQGIQGQQNLANTLTPQASSAVANQNALAQQLYGMTQGQGPNPAQMQLNQATGQNIASQASLMAGQRGAGANAGLIAREAAQQGAATQQQAASQASVLEAQQQIAAQQNLAGLAGTQIGQTSGAIQGLNTAAQNEQNILQNANTAANNAAVSMQGNINSTNAQTAAGNQSMAGNILGSVGSAVSAILNKGGVVGQDGQEMAEHLKLAEMNAHSIAHGRKNYAPGGQIVGNPLLGNQTTNQNPNVASSGQYTAPSSSNGPSMGSVAAAPSLKDNMSEGIGDAAGDIKDKLAGPKITESVGEETPWETGGGLAGGAGDTMDNSAPMSPGAGLAGDLGPLEFAAHGGEIHHVAQYLFAEGGKVPAMVSPGEIYLTPDQVHRVVHEEVDPAKIGKKFAGKAKVKGDSLKNDTIPTDLEEGGVVIDRKNMATKDKRRAFVHRAVARAKARK